MQAVTDTGWDVLSSDKSGGDLAENRLGASHIEYTRPKMDQSGICINSFNSDV